MERKSGTGANWRGRWSQAQWTLVGIILSLSLGVIVYRLLHAQKLNETAALFIGLPTIMAVAAALSPRAKSATGMVVKGLVIGLLMAGPVLQEGFVCVLLASPLFLLVGVGVGKLIDYVRAQRENNRTQLYSLLLLPLVFASIEGTAPAWTFPTTITAQADRLVVGSGAAVEARLGLAPDLEKTLPPFLRIGFPRPTGATGTGLAVGDRRTITFPGRAGPRELVFEVAERGPGSVRLRAVSDTTPIAGWLQWEYADVRWQEIEPGTTRVTWALHFQRRLSPAWYFGPLEAYGATQAAEYLIDVLATP